MTLREFKSEYLDEIVVDTDLGHHYLCESISMVDGEFTVKLYDGKNNITRIDTLEDFFDMIQRKKYKLDFNLLCTEQSDFIYDIYHMRLIEHDNARFDGGCRRLINRVYRRGGYRNGDKLLLNKILTLYQKGKLELK